MSVNNPHVPLITYTMQQLITLGQAQSPMAQLAALPAYAQQAIIEVNLNITAERRARKYARRIAG